VCVCVCVRAWSACRLLPAQSLRSSSHGDGRLPDLETGQNKCTVQIFKAAGTAPATHVLENPFSDQGFPQGRPNRCELSPPLVPSGVTG